MKNVPELYETLTVDKFIEILKQIQERGKGHYPVNLDYTLLGYFLTGEYEIEGGN